MANQTRVMEAVIVGSTDSFKKAMGDVVAQNTKAQTSFKDMTTAVAAGQAVWAAFQRVANTANQFLGGAIDYTKTFASQTLSLQRTFGMTAEEGSGLVAVFNRFGIESDNASKALGIFQKNMMEVRDSESGGKAIFGQLGINVQQSNGQLRDMNSVLLDVADRFKNDIPVTERAAAAKDLFGRSGQSLIPILIQGRQGIINLEEAARKMGVTLSQDNVNAVRAASIAQKDFNQQVNGIKLQIGLAAMPVLTAFAGAMRAVAAGHGEAIAKIGLAAAGVAAMGGIIWGVTKIVKAFQIESIAAFVTNPMYAALGVLGALVGYTLYNAMGKMQQKMNDASRSGDELGSTLGGTVADGAEQATNAMGNMKEQLADLDEQVAKANRDFREQMAEMVKSHQDKVANLNEQIGEETASFQQSQQEQTDNFRENQEQQATEHDKKVNDIQKQINKQLAMGRNANQQELADLRAQLDEENRQYEAKRAKDQLQYEADQKKAQAEHDKKMAQMQAQLKQETDLLSKHAADVAGVRQSDFVDEITKLKRSHDEQMKALDKQRDSIIKSGQQTIAGLGGLSGQASSTGTALGNAMGNAMKDAIKDAIIDTGKGLANFLGKATTFIAKGFDPRKTNQSLSQIWQESQNDPAFRFRASGGPVSAGVPYVVGEEGQELFIPAQNGTIVNARDTKDILTGAGSGGGGNGGNQYITNLDIKIQPGIFTGMPSELRELAVMLYRELTREAKSRGVQLPNIGVTTQ